MRGTPKPDRGGALLVLVDAGTTQGTIDSPDGLWFRRVMVRARRNPARSRIPPRYLLHKPRVVSIPYGDSMFAVDKYKFISPIV